MTAELDCTFALRAIPTLERKDFMPTYVRYLIAAMRNSSEMGIAVK
jgi:hypothetical protein